jgi:hypothetical protein
MRIFDAFSSVPWGNLGFPHAGLRKVLVCLQSITSVLKFSSEHLGVKPLTSLKTQNLRYKDYQFLRSESVEQGRLQVEPGKVKEFDSIKALAAELGECGILDWWNLSMGFKVEG